MPQWTRSVLLTANGRGVEGWHVTHILKWARVTGRPADLTLTKSCVKGEIYMT